eukprot:CAMPEP_0177563830 /NCGR_PEP_ID=MMETSP0369-20130122/73303_1 /TAXON_ID=447022 ORGANISM="Scrippsiella hangoei-like, Strain SHHI-4" /NCGR_SAMPLE_ID=MMETSP0369 /ASSEMBLY_ACC=CAM_ASM_000364 /LENGTH=43 /DNA_ID= /DNA_START= /DNA_END= /DNA_ORIENTATION=
MSQEYDRRGKRGFASGFVEHIAIGRISRVEHTSGNSKTCTLVV